MSIFQEKLEYACRAFSVTVEDIGKTTKISPFSLHLHATGQKDLSHNEMVLLCQYFDLTYDYFTNDNIRYIDEDILSPHLCKLLDKAYEKMRIKYYEVLNEGDPDLTPEKLEELLNYIESQKNE